MPNLATGPKTVETSASANESIIHKNLIEAALFMSPKPMQMEELMRVTGIGSLGYLKETLKCLQKDYVEKGLEIIENPEGWHMKVRKEFLSRVAGLTPHSDLSEGCKKALAFVVYKEPLKQSELIKMQGSKAYAYVKDLERRGLIRSEKLGHTKLLKVTSEFESYFGETKEQIRKRIMEAIDMPGEPVEKQKTIADYSPGQGEASVQQEGKNEFLETKFLESPKYLPESAARFSETDEIKSQIEEALEDDINLSAGTGKKVVGQPRLKPIKREKPVRIKIRREKTEKTEEPEAKNTGQKPVNKTAAKQDLSGVKELTVDDLKK